MNGTTSNSKASAQQEKQLKLKGSLWNGRRFLQTLYWIKGYYPKYTKNLYTLVKKRNNLLKIGKKKLAKLSRKFPKRTSKWPAST